jgi:hypothetical protein
MKSSHRRRRIYQNCLEHSALVTGHQKDNAIRNCAKAMTNRILKRRAANKVARKARRRNNRKW